MHTIHAIGVCLYLECIFSMTDSAEPQLCYWVNDPYRESHRDTQPLNHPTADNNTNASHNTHIAAAVVLDLYILVQHLSVSPFFFS